MAEQRVITRHPSNKGSVMKLDLFGKKIDLLVADAKYRALKRWGEIFTEIPELKTVDIDKPHIYFDDARVESHLEPLSHNLSDSELQTRFPDLKRDNSALVNTDALVEFPVSEAALWCREHGFDLPNIHELMAIYLEADRLDALDPTVEEYPDFALGIKNPNGRFNFSNTGAAWSSTDCDGASARAIDSLGHADNSEYRGYKCGVIPVKEIPA